MLFAVILHGFPEKLETRTQLLASHVEWLDEHRDTIVVAGSLRQDEDANPVGGLWIHQGKDVD